MLRKAFNVMFGMFTQIVSILYFCNGTTVTDALHAALSGQT
jgi:hypothetical protein